MPTKYGSTFIQLMRPRSVMIARTFLRTEPKILAPAAEVSVDYSYFCA